MPYFVVGSMAASILECIHVAMWDWRRKAALAEKSKHTIQHGIPLLFFLLFAPLTFPSHFFSSLFSLPLYSLHLFHFPLFSSLYMLLSACSKRSSPHSNFLIKTLKSNTITHHIFYFNFNFTSDGEKISPIAQFIYDVVHHTSMKPTRPWVHNSNIFSYFYVSQISPVNNAVRYAYCTVLYCTARTEYNYQTNVIKLK